MNLFYDPNIEGEFHTLNREESKHIVRVLRKKNGDKIHFTDGQGKFFNCVIIDDNHNGCQIQIVETTSGKDQRNYLICIGVAPTKNISRYEWFLEKATEIGIDRIIPFYSAHSERTIVKPDRLNKVLVAAMKQSLKSQLPELSPARSFKQLVSEPFNGHKFIAYIDEGVTQLISEVYRKGSNVLILIGPEGDFSPEEVALAIEYGFQTISLGPSRLRTETAAVVACHTINFLNL